MLHPSSFIYPGFHGRATAVPAHSSHTLLKMMLPPVHDVFARSQDGSASLLQPRIASDLFTKSTAAAVTARLTISARSATVRKEDIPNVLHKLSKMPAFSPAKDVATGADPDNSAIVFDIDALRASFAGVRHAFPPHWIHCMAIKCCPLAFVIEELLGAELGVEAASIVELYMALAHGCPSNLAVFDSPAKTDEELEMALSAKTLVNANSLEELDRIDAVLRRISSAAGAGSEASPNISSGRYIADNARVGIRLNPLVGAGKLSELSTSVPNSKFGVPVTAEKMKAVVDAFRRWPWLVGLHVHVGSQGCALEQLGDGVATVCNVADEIEDTLGKGRVAVLDIGGGLPANYDSDEVTPTFEEYAEVLRIKAPKLFSNTKRLVLTEFGRSLMAKAAFVVSKVEYVRANAGPQQRTNIEQAGGIDSPSIAATAGHQTLVTHMGADLFLRSSYCPGKYVHRLSIYDKGGTPLTGPLIQTEVAGPLCFEGDYLAKGSKLQRASSGDLLVAHDTGANTVALFSRHCSRRAPAVYGYAAGNDGELTVRLIKEKESVRDVARFWGAR